MNYIVDIRDRRQITLPKELLAKIDVKVGDKLVFEPGKDGVKMKPQKQVVIDSLKAIQNAFKDSKASLKEVLKSGEEIRRKLADERYGKQS